MQLLVLGLYRASNSMEKSVLPFVCTCPRAEMELALRDKVYVYCNPIEMRNAFIKGLNARLVHNADGTISLGSDQPKTVPSTRNRAQSLDSLGDSESDDD